MRNGYKALGIIYCFIALILVIGGVVVCNLYDDVNKTLFQVEEELVANEKEQYRLEQEENNLEVNESTLNKQQLNKHNEKKKPIENEKFKAKAEEFTLKQEKILYLKMKEDYISFFYDLSVAGIFLTVVSIAIAYFIAYVSNNEKKEKKVSFIKKVFVLLKGKSSKITSHNWIAYLVYGIGIILILYLVHGDYVMYKDLRSYSELEFYKNVMNRLLTVFTVIGLVLGLLQRKMGNSDTIKLQISKLPIMILLILGIFLIIGITIIDFYLSKGDENWVFLFEMAILSNVVNALFTVLGLYFPLLEINKSTSSHKETKASQKQTKNAPQTQPENAPHVNARTENAPHPQPKKKKRRKKKRRR
ncbi:hypothetical protein [Peribacillus asahii]|uniref:hypothetical protein n=1 Tax=Peribacillus asahii TaxID=228899 RepID=UPI00207A27FF|nr:hypothetical protein [Peribacillus asahii]USK62291.1 hypothetical protein LIT37_24265 [Peribacillus asahii]